MQNNSLSHDNLNHSSRKRSRLQIRLESLCIKKTKVKKSVVKDSVCIRDIREFFWPSFCGRRLTGRIIVWLIYIHILHICRKITLLRCALWACGYRAWIKKRSRNITDFFRSLYGSVFWFFRFDFLLTWIVPWQDKWDFRRIFLLIVPWQDKGI